MVGKGVLLECLDAPRVSEVLLLNRNSLKMKHPKLKEILHADFYDFSALIEEIKNYDACFHCMGVSSAGMGEAQYAKLTYDISLALANTCFAANQQMTFNYVSGTGTDSSEKGRSMWARVKGKTENHILKLGFRQAFMFRPGVIRPMRGIKSRTKLYQTAYNIMNPFWPFFEWVMGKNLTNTSKIGIAMINSVDKGFEKVYLENPEINLLANN